MNFFSSHTPSVIHKTFWPKSVMRAAFGLDEAEAAALLADAEAPEEADDGLLLLLGPPLLPSQLTNGQDELLSVERVE